MSPVGTTGNCEEGKTMATEAERVKVVQTEFERLQQYLAALPQDAWAKPSACALWEVRDVVAHLIRVPNNYTGHITRALRGDTSPPEGRQAPDNVKTLSQEERLQRRMELAQGPIATRERLGNDLLSGFGQAWDQFNRLIVTLSAQDWHKACFHGFGIIPVRSLVNAGAFELTIHSWDIRSALEPSASLSPGALAAMLDFFSECLHWFFFPDARLPTPLRYRFAFTGALSSQWDMVVEGDTAHMEAAAETTPADAAFGCDGETFALLMCGRLGFEAALRDKRVILTGDMAGAQAFTKWFQGVVL
jgi:uncharacterized protein (TIGR03083 family)